MTQKVDSNNRKILELLLNTETVTVAWLSQEIGFRHDSEKKTFRYLVRSK